MYLIEPSPDYSKEYYLISWFFKMFPKTFIFWIKNIVLRLSFPNHYSFRFQFTEFNCSKTTPQKLKVEFYFEVKRTVYFCRVVLYKIDLKDTDGKGKGTK